MFSKSTVLEPGDMIETVSTPYLVITDPRYETIGLLDLVSCEVLEVKNYGVCYGELLTIPYKHIEYYNGQETKYKGKENE